MQEFDRRDFEFLCRDCFTEHDRGNNGIARFLHITDEGVFYDECLQEGGEATKCLRWKPVHELTGPNKPSSSGPALPFPFTANQLAAFMLWGYWASDFQNAFGQLNCGPNEFVLNGDHEDATDAYEALRQAYVIYRDALHVVGELDHQEQQHAYDLQKQSSDAYDQALEREKVMERVIIGKHKNGNPEYGDFIPRDEYLPRLARAKESVAVQKAQAEKAKEQADAALKAWRKAMVRQLLQPPAPTPSLAPSWEKDYPRLWHALRFDEERMKTAIETLERSRPTSSTDVVSRKEKLEAWRIELAQIHKRMDFIGSGVDVEVMHAAEIGYVIKEMTNSRPRDCEIDVHQQNAEIKDANEKVDALIAEATPPSPAPAPQAAPVAAVSASGGVESAAGKRWTPEKLAELKSYRDKHGTKKAAEYFAISEQLIRRKLPSEKPQPKGYSAFTHRIK